MGVQKKRRAGPLDNRKEETFCQLIVNGMNTYAAFGEAGYKPHRGNAYRLRDTERIILRINELRAKLIRKVERSLDLTVERITEEFAKIGFAQATDVLAIRDGQVILQDTEHLNENTRAAIAEVRQTKDGIVVKMHDKSAALTQLAKHMGYYKENVQLNVTLSLADLVNMSYQQEIPAPDEAKVIEHDDVSNK